jgi:hypothetical protein
MIETFHEGIRADLKGIKWNSDGKLQLMSKDKV